MIRHRASQLHLRAPEDESLKQRSAERQQGQPQQVDRKQPASNATKAKQIQSPQVNCSCVQSESDFKISLREESGALDDSGDLLMCAKFRCAPAISGAQSSLSPVILSIAFQLMVFLSRDQVNATNRALPTNPIDVMSALAPEVPPALLLRPGAAANKCHRWTRRLRPVEWPALVAVARRPRLHLDLEPRLFEVDRLHDNEPNGLSKLDSAQTRRRRRRRRQTTARRALVYSDATKLTSLAELLRPAGVVESAQPDEEFAQRANLTATSDSEPASALDETNSAKPNLDDNVEDELAGSTTSGEEQPQLESTSNDEADIDGQPGGLGSSCRRLVDIKSGIPSISIRIVFFSLYGLIFAIGLLGNTLTLYAMRRKRRDRFSVIDIFIANLALSDIMLCLFAVPITPIYSLYHGYWVFGPILCKALAFAQGSSVYISTFTMISIAHLRYQLIVHPLSDSMSKLTAFLLNLLTWIIGFLVTLPYLMHVGLLPENCSIKFCDESWDHEIDRFWFSVITIILQFCLPFIAVSFFYGSIFWKLRQQRNIRRQQPQKSHRRQPPAVAADQLAGK